MKAQSLMWREKSQSLQTDIHSSTKEEDIKGLLSVYTFPKADIQFVIFDLTRAVFEMLLQITLQNANSQHTGKGH